MIDFSYDGEKLSDYGCMVTGVVTSFAESVPVSTALSLETIRNRTDYHNKIINMDYDGVITATFDICKNPCLFDTQEKMSFTDGEVSHYMRWLHRESYYKFKPIYDNANYSDVYFYGTFTSISEIIVGGNIIGFTLTFTSNSPFGYVDDKEYNVTVKEANGQFVFYDDSDKIGYLYPYYFQVECLASGKLRISNDRDTKATVIENCVSGEIITMDCLNKVIQSSEVHSRLYNDFNYNYPRIQNSYDNRKNVFTTSLPCNITIRYAPTRKAGIV